MGDLDTGEFLAVHLPHLKPLKSWLHYLNDMIGKLKTSGAKGNAEFYGQLTGGTRIEQTKWTYSDRHSNEKR